HARVDSLKGEPLKATADKMLLKHVRNGKPLAESDPDFNNAAVWDELVFGDNASRADLAESMVGLLNAQADSANAKKNAKLSKIGFGVSMVSSTLELSAGI